MKCDWNDLHCLMGADEVRAQFMNRTKPEPPNENAQITAKGDHSSSGLFAEKPILFEEQSLPKFDTSVLPPVLRTFIEETATSLQVPPELVFANAMAAASTCLQKRVQVRIHEDYAEPANFYWLAALPPGERKSATVEACKRPLLEWEHEIREQYIVERQHAESDRKSMERYIGDQRASLGKVKDPNELHCKMDEIRTLEAGLSEVPEIPRLFIDNATPESVAFILSKQEERLTVMEAEGGLFEILGGLYSNGTPNIDLFLKAFNGEPVTVDRRNSESIRLENPLLTICISPQPEVVAKLADKPGFRGRGLLARFAYLLPRSLVGYRTVDTTPVPEKVKSAYAAKLRSLLDINPLKNDAGHSAPHNIQLSAGANAVRLAMAQYIEENMREGGELDGIKDWASKLTGNTLRLAGVLHFYEHENALTMPISQKTMETAAYIAGVLVDHAKAAFSLMKANPALQCAKKIAVWITRSRPEPMLSFTGRDCLNALRGTYPTMDEINEGLAILEGRYFITKDARPKKVGRPSELYLVNPELFGGVE